MTTPAQPRTPDRDSPAFAGPYAPGQPMPSDEQITAYLEMESYMARALAHTTDGSSIEERTAIAVRFVRAAVAEPGGNDESEEILRLRRSRVPAQPEGDDPCEVCGYSAHATSAETGRGLYCVVCDARSRSRDFQTERDEARAALTTLRTLAGELCEAASEMRRAQYQMQSDWSESSDTKKNELWKRLHRAGIPLLDAINSLSAHLASVPASPPAPQPEAATGERPPPTVETAEGWRSKCEVLGEEDSWRVRYGFPVESYLAPIGWLDVGAWQRASHKDCYFPTESAAYAALTKAPPPPGVEPAPTAATVTLPLADAQGLLRAIDAWGLVLKPAIVLREAIERAKP